MSILVENHSSQHFKSRDFASFHPAQGIKINKVTFQKSIYETFAHWTMFELFSPPPNLKNNYQFVLRVPLLTSAALEYFFPFKFTIILFFEDLPGSEDDHHLCKGASSSLFLCHRVITIIITTRPKPAYSWQGLAGLWGQDTYQAGTFLGVVNISLRAFSAQLG